MDVRSRKRVSWGVRKLTDSDILARIRAQLNVLRCVAEKIYATGGQHPNECFTKLQAMSTGLSSVIEKNKRYM
jgi:hypothetical protein